MSDPRRGRPRRGARTPLGAIGRPVWLWIVIALYALIGAGQTLAGLGLFGEGAGVLPVLATVSGVCALSTAWFLWTANRRAVDAAQALLGAFAALVLYGTIVLDLPTRLSTLLLWALLVLALTGAVRAARDRGHLN